MRDCFIHLVLLVLCALGGAANAQNVNIIPQPNSVVMEEGTFNFTKEIKLQYTKTNQEVTEVVKFFMARLGEFPVNTFSKYKTTEPNRIEFYLQKLGGNSDYYELIIQRNAIIIRANKPKGLFYGVQSLLQLVNNYQRKGAVILPCMQVQDRANLSWRGMHLDVGRHMFSVKSIKRYIDLMSYYKLNYFHWHLTEDQGWRIEIKKYPKLTEVGSWRKETIIGHYNDEPQRFDSTRYGGFYTQDEIRDIVAYAKDRYVEIVPEIEMPGHALAALAAYPEYGCAQKKYEVGTKWGVFDDIFCPTEETFVFLENILTEVIALFPGSYIHIGGDEAPKTSWKESAFCQQLMKTNGLKDEAALQSFFIKRIDKFLTGKGKKMIGWDEILEGGLSPNATVMSWRGMEGGIEAANQGHEVIMTPTSHCYFDYYQSTEPDEPLAIGGFLPLEKVYNYNPVPAELDEAKKKLILGTQANLWTEYMKTNSALEYMMLPRLLAIAEAAWTRPPVKSFENFCSKLDEHFEYFKRKKFSYADKLSIIQSKVFAGEGTGVKMTWGTLRKKDLLKYEIYGLNQKLLESGTVKRDTFAVTRNGSYRAKLYKNGVAVGKPLEIDFNLHLAAGKKISLKYAPALQYSGNGIGSLVNGVIGNRARYGDAEWLGFEGEDCIATIDFSKKNTFNTFKTTFYSAPGQWIYSPLEVIVSGSDDGVKFVEIARGKPTENQSNLSSCALPLGGRQFQYLKIWVKNYGVIPEGQQGAGNKAWLFVDELEVN